MLASAPTVAWFVPVSFASSGLSSLINRATAGLSDDTFKGIHHLVFFDWAMMIPYFGLLIVLSCYGLHRYTTIRRYLKHRAQFPASAQAAGRGVERMRNSTDLAAPGESVVRDFLETPPRRFEELPRVTIQLPLFNERYVVQRLLEATVEIDYPRELLQIQVLDDSTDDTAPFTRRLAAGYRAAGFPIEYIHRDNRDGFKAGALQKGLETATGELLAIFDADFVPPRDFLQRTVHFFAEENVGVVQTRWSYLNRHYNLLTEVQAMLLDGHFVLEHVARAGSGLFFNFNGTAGILRKSMIADAGGWQHDTLTEDSDLSYRAQLKGWKFVYLPSIECPSELPVETYGFQVQQSRWAKGLTQVAKKLLIRILRSDQPFGVKAEAFFHLTPNISYPLMIVVSALMLPVMIIRFYQGWFQMLLIDLPLIAASFWPLMAFYMVAHRALFPKTWKRGILFLPALMAAGIALTLINSRAVMEALIGYRTEFTRTAKYAVGDHDRLRLRQAKYRRRSGWLPYAEIAAGSFFLWMTAYAINSMNYLATPFLLLFVGGYYWAGFTTLWQEHQGKLEFERQRDLATEKAEA